MVAKMRIGFLILGIVVVLPQINAIVYDIGVSYNQAVNDKQQVMSVSAAAAATSKRYIVHKRNDDKVKADSAKHRGKVVSELKDFTVLSFSNSTDAASFASMGYFVEEDVKRYPMTTTVAPESYLHHNHSQRNLLSAQVIPWGIDRVFNGVLPTPDYYPSTTNPTKKLCIIDSGVWTNHPDLTGISFTAADPNQAGNIEDSCAHGTHVTGTVVANNNDFGVIGIFPGAPVLVVRVFTGKYCSWTYSSTLIQAADYCVAKGANIISMSLGGYSYSSAENTAFQGYKNGGVLSVAAAGNDGTSTLNYPASYTSVVSVTATDQNNNRAYFSSFNSAVDIAAPGVSVSSTALQGTDFNGTAGNQDIVLKIMDNSVRPTTNIFKKSCLCSPTSCPSNCNGLVCIIPRGCDSYEAKGLACQASKGIAAIIYNNFPDFFSGSLSTPTSVTIPVFSTSGSYGVVLVNAYNAGTNVFVNSSVAVPYPFDDGTSMATPHVSGVIFLLWNKFSACTSSDILNAVLNTALDLGASGRDDYFGAGLVQYWAAATYLQQPGRCGAGASAPAQRPLAKPAPVKGPSSPSVKKVPSSPVKAPSSPLKVPSSPLKGPSSLVKVPSSPLKVPFSPGKLPSSPVKAPYSPFKVFSSPVRVPSLPMKVPSSPMRVPVVAPAKPAVPIVIPVVGPVKPPIPSKPLAPVDSPVYAPVVPVKPLSPVTPVAGPVVQVMPTVLVVAPMNPSASLSASGAPVTNPSAPVIASSSPVTNPSAPVVSPTVPVAAPMNPSAPLSASGALVTNPSAPVVASSSPVKNPSAPVVLPTVPVAAPMNPPAPLSAYGAPVTNPSAPVVASSAPVTNASAPNASPGAPAAINPSAPGVASNAQAVINPSAPTVASNANAPMIPSAPVAPINLQGVANDESTLSY